MAVQVRHQACSGVYESDTLELRKSNTCYKNRDEHVKMGDGNTEDQDSRSHSKI